MRRNLGRGPGFETFVITLNGPDRLPFRNRATLREGRIFARTSVQSGSFLGLVVVLTSTLKAWARMDFVDRFQVGASDTMAISVSQAMCDAFGGLSGDDAPLHTDDDFARRNGFERRLVHGAMVF